MGAVVNHRTGDEIMMISVASDLFMILQRVPESIKRPTFLFPIFSVVFFGSF